MSAPSLPSARLQVRLVRLTQTVLPFFKDDLKSSNEMLTLLVPLTTDDHAFFVEPACSASLTPIYDPSILQAALPSTLFLPPGTAPPKSAPAIVVIVCGGNSMSLDTLALWEADFKGKGLGEVTVLKAGKETVIQATP